MFHLFHPGLACNSSLLLKQAHLVVGDPDQSSNQLAPQARLNVRVFEKCRTLRTIGLERTKYDPRDPNRVIPEGCFLGTGLEMIDLPADFSWIGPA